MIGWFEIPANNIERAINFYNTILGIDIKLENLGHEKLGLFPRTDSVNGVIIEGPKEYYKPADQGIIIYLSVETEIEYVLEKVDLAGGRIFAQKWDVGDMSLAIFIDTEGNKIGLHKKKEQKDP